jgi:molybdopterin molybdotransferase
MPNRFSNHPNADVRMRGFAERSTVEQARAWIDSTLPRFDELKVDEAPLLYAAGRVMAGEVVSGVNIPAFARAMMDGFAVRAADTQGASSYNQLPLQLVGTSLPGKPFAGEMPPGAAVKIMTGAPLPAGADAVLPFEQADFDKDRVLALGEVTPRKHLGEIGEDVRAGDVVYQAGRRLRPQDVGMLSALGISQLTVVCRPRVRILITGNELLPAGTPPEGCQITDANGPMLAALVTRDGGEPIMSPIIQDDRDAIFAAMQEEADMLLVSGGSSVGQEDHVPTLLAEHGELAIHGVAMRPSSPAGMGRLGDRLVFLLPGNPVSCLCAYDFFAGRAIRALAGLALEWPYRGMQARLSRKLSSVVGRVDYARVKVHGDEAEPLAIGGASVLSSVTRADGFVIIPANSEGYAEGATVEVFLY